MTIEVSQQTTDRIAAIIGTSDLKLVEKIVERVAQDQLLIQNLVSQSGISGDLQDSLNDIDADQWVERLYAISSRLPACGVRIDDSRKSIYPDRS